MTGIKEACGICAADTPGRNVAPDLYQMLLDLQHRGQAGAGLSTYNPGRKIILRTHKGLGTVPEVFGGSDPDAFTGIMESRRGSGGIGHTRYGTSGSISSRHVQPFERVHGIKKKWFCFGFNGHLTNRKELEERIKGYGFHLMLDTDTEVLLHMISKFISDIGRPDAGEIFRRLSEELDGAFNLTYVDAEGNVAAMRDPWGIRPLSGKSSDTGAFAASETCALYRMGTGDIRHIKPGEMALLSEGEIHYERYTPKRRKALCFFELIYFASVTSELDGRSVYETRKRCGEELARIEDLPLNEEEWVVIPAPNTARPIARAYAREMNVPRIFDEGLISVSKGRTFIDEGDRSKKVMRKFLPIPSVTRGKKVVVVDDSIVRSTTMATLVKYHLKKIGGASEVHVRIGTPPIIAPCYYGIDMKTFDELIAAPYQDRIEKGIMDGDAQAEIAERINAESLKYMTHDGLINALGFDRSEVCMACLNRDYPTPGGKERDDAAYCDYRKRVGGC